MSAPRSQKRFHYKRTLLLPIYLASLTVPCFLSFGVYETIHGDLSAGNLLLICGLFLLTMFFLVQRQHWGIRADGLGIGAYFLGYQRKFIPWVQLKKILRVREFDASSHKYLYFFYFLDVDHYDNFHMRKIRSNSPHGPVLFDETIVGIQGLLDLINQAVTQYSIPIDDIDREADSQRGQTMWERLEPSELKHPITKLSIQ